MSWEIHYTSQARKDAKRIAKSGLKDTTKDLIEVLRRNPFQIPPPYEKLVGDLKGYYSRRINIHHRLVYQVMLPDRAVKIVRMWTHYE